MIDIFSRTKGKEAPLWLESVDSFEKAFLRLVMLSAHNPGNYIAVYKAEVVAEVHSDRSVF